MEQTFTDQIPNIKPNPDGSWPQSAKHKAPRYEVPSGTDLVETEFNLNLGERPGPGRVYIIGLMSGPLGQAHPIGSLAIGADDQWLVTGHPEIQEPGKQRVRVNWLNPYRIVMVWEKDHNEITYTIHQGNKLVHQITIPSSLNLDSGGRVLVGQDVKNPKRLKDLHSLPPFGSILIGTISASDMDDDEGDNTTVEPRPVDPLPPIQPPPPITVPPIPPVVQPPVIKPSPPVTNQSSGFNFEAFPEFVSAAIAFYPELGKSLGQITPYIQAIQAGKKLADGNFNISNPNDLIAVLQLVNLFKTLR